MKVAVLGVAMDSGFLYFPGWTPSTRMQQGEYRFLRYGFRSYAPSEEMGGLLPERAYCGV